MNNEIKTALKIYKTFLSHYNTYACNMWAIGRDIDTKSAKSTLSMNLKSFLYASCGFFLIFCLLLKI